MRCALCRRTLSLSSAYERESICPYCGARLRVVNKRWLVSVNLLLYPCLLVVSLWGITHPLLGALGAVGLAGLIQWAMLRWVVRTRPRRDIYWR